MRSFLKNEIIPPFPSKDFHRVGEGSGGFHTLLCNFACLFASLTYSQNQWQEETQRWKQL